MKCIDVRQEQCYDSFNREQCSEPRGMSITAKECCCSKGAAWGRYCERCPPEGSRKYKHYSLLTFLDSFSLLFFYFIPFIWTRFYLSQALIQLKRCIYSNVYVNLHVRLTFIFIIT